MEQAMQCTSEECQIMKLHFLAGPVKHEKPFPSLKAKKHGSRNPL